MPLTLSNPCGECGRKTITRLSCLPHAQSEILEKEQKRVKKRKSTISSSGKLTDVKPERSEFISGLIAVSFPDTLGGEHSQKGGDDGRREI